jgi:hypothetical protein
MRITHSIWLVAVMCIGSASASAEAQTLRRTDELSLGSSANAGPMTTDSKSNSRAIATTESQGGAAQGVGSQGQALTVDSHAVYEAPQRNPVSTAVAPQLTSSNDTCMGSTSFGGSAVSFGFSVGSTWTDTNCLMLKNAREIWNMGFKGAALARLCMDDLNREALESTGINCPARRRSGSAQASQATQSMKIDGANNTQTGDRN